MRPVPTALLAGALALSALVGCAPAKTPRLPFMENDFQGALARARQDNRPLFVEYWAPW